MREEGTDKKKKIERGIGGENERKKKRHKGEIEKRTNAGIADGSK